VKYKKILIIQTASLGDVILATPILEKLHAHFPDASIDFLCKKGSEEVFYRHPYVDQVLVWNKSKHKYRRLFDLVNYVRDQKYDLLINCQRFFSTGFLTTYSKARTKIGFAKNPWSIFFNQRIKHEFNIGGVHEIDRNLRLLKFLEDDKRFLPKVYPSVEDDAKVSAFKTRKYICIAPVSLWNTKELKSEVWIDFLNRFDKDFYVYALGSKADKEKIDVIKSSTTHTNFINLSGKLSVLESAALIRDAQMNVVLDSAPMHLASAVNARTTSVFCSTIPQFGFTPLAEYSIIVEVEGQLKCRPCGVHGKKKCPKGHFKCGEINVDKLLKRTE